MTDHRTVDELLAEWTLDERDFGGGKTPKEFYLVFDIPSYDGSDPLKWAKEIKAGRMKGVIGVSADPQIIKQFGYRGGLLVMGGEEFAKLNKLSRLQYDNPHYLVQDNLAALYRIWDKNPKSKEGTHGLIFNIGQYLISKSNGDFKRRAEYSAIHQEAAYYYSNRPRKFKGIDDLAAWLYDVYNKFFSEEHHWINMTKEVTLATFKGWLLKALEHIGKTYSNESEWIVKDRDLKIPKSVQIYYLMDQITFDKVMKKFPKLTDLEKQQAIRFGNGLFIEIAERLEQAKKLLRGFKFKIVAKEGFKP